MSVIQSFQNCVCLNVNIQPYNDIRRLLGAISFERLSLLYSPETPLSIVLSTATRTWNAVSTLLPEDHV